MAAPYKIQASIERHATADDVSDDGLLVSAAVQAFIVPGHQLHEEYVAVGTRGLLAFHSKGNSPDHADVALVVVRPA